MAQSNSKRILIPADVPTRESLERALRNGGWMPLAYSDVSDAEAVLSRAPAAAIVLGRHKGGRAPLELVKTVRRLCPDAFVLGMGPQAGKAADAVLRERCTPEEVVSAISSAAQLRALTRQLGELEKQTRRQLKQIEELERRNAELRAEADRDNLTGLFNRRYFMQQAEAEIERARRAGTRFAIAMVDLDHFKHFNDTYGHVMGDRILARFAKVLSRNLRKMDTKARYGGEEFIMLMPETHEGTTRFDPYRLIERLRKAIERDPFLNGKNRFKAPVTISAGVVQYPTDGRKLADLILKVDERLFRAKQRGRNQVCASDD